MRKTMRSAFSLLRGQMNDWFYSPRTIIMTIFILLLDYLYSESFMITVADNHPITNLGEAVFIYLSTGFGNITLTCAMFLIMVSEIPRRTAFQNNMLIRTSRFQWLISQFLFSFFAVVLMLVLMLLFGILLIYPTLSPGTGWNVVGTDAANYGLELIPQYIQAIRPIEAIFLAGTILFAFLFTMTQVILAFSITGKPNFGLILYVFILVLHVTVFWEMLPQQFRWMPVFFSNLESVASLSPDNELNIIAKVMLGYLMINICLALFMVIRVRTLDLRFNRRDEG